VEVSAFPLTVVRQMDDDGAEMFVAADSG